MICVECGAQMRKTSEPMEETFRGVALILTGIEHYKCDNCGEVVLSAKEAKKYDRQLISAYSSKVGLLRPDEIKAIRNKYQLTQQEFERVLGVVSPSVSRWETGKVIPSKQVDLLMRAYDEKPDLMRKRMEEVGVAAIKQTNIIQLHPRRAVNQQGYFSSARMGKSLVNKTLTLGLPEHVKEG